MVFEGVSCQKTPIPISSIFLYLFSPKVPFFDGAFGFLFDFSKKFWYHYYRKLNKGGKRRKWLFQMIYWKPCFCLCGFAQFRMIVRIALYTFSVTSKSRNGNFYHDRDTTCLGRFSRSLAPLIFWTEFWLYKTPHFYTRKLDGAFSTIYNENAPYLVSPPIIPLSVPKVNRQNHQRFFLELRYLCAFCRLT